MIEKVRYIFTKIFRNKKIVKTREKNKSDTKQKTNEKIDLDLYIKQRYLPKTRNEIEKLIKIINIALSTPAWMVYQKDFPDVISWDIRPRRLRKYKEILEIRLFEILNIKTYEEYNLLLLKEGKIKEHPEETEKKIKEEFREIKEKRRKSKIKKQKIYYDENGNKIILDTNEVNFNPNLLDK